MQFCGNIDWKCGDKGIVTTEHEKVRKSQQGKIPVPKFIRHLNLMMNSKFIIHPHNS
jgi:hypothetical protein